MKILYDHQIFSYQKFGGISRYFIQIIANLPKDFTWEIATRFSDNGYIKAYKNISPLETYNPVGKLFANVKFPGKKRLLHSIEVERTNHNRRLSVEALKKQDFDVFHPTYYDDYFLDYIGNKPYVLTIHDMIHEIYPEMFNDPGTSKRKALLAENASHIIAVSANTKKDIIDIMGIAPEKISVVYHANSLVSPASISPDSVLRYLLYVGDRENYKNFLFFVRAIEPLMRKDSDLKVICAGTPFTKKEMVFLKELDIFDRFMTRKVNDNDLALMYKNALAFVYPSYYEGFGIPIVESLSMGCPVILSKSSCFPEVAGDVGIYFDPKEITSIRSAIERVIFDEKFRQSLSRRSLEYASRFSWSTAAEITSNMYKKLTSPDQSMELAS